MLGGLGVRCHQRARADSFCHRSIDRSNGRHKEGWKRRGNLHLAVAKKTRKKDARFMVLCATDAKVNVQRHFEFFLFFFSV